MPRPATGRKGQNVTLYLNSAILSASRKHAFECGISLSELLNTLLRQELSKSMGRGRTSCTSSID